MGERVQIELRDTGEGPVGVVLRGSADVAAMGSLHKRLLDALPAGRDVEVHVEELEKLDGAGVQLLFATKRFVQQGEHKFSLVIGDGAARRAIETAGARAELEGEVTCRS